jgi:2-polyprenyl-3-methyl-5-hydroxy-6-metoxy-1,4-benzoquinol methylase
VKACDFSEKIVNFAQKRENNVHFYIRNIYDLKRENDNADLVICCEVLEHLENPEKALDKLSKIANKYLLISVPNEPIWRVLNVARGAHLKRFGNTPGHINHWTSKQFYELVSNYMQIIEIRKPLPWTILFLKKEYEK